MPVPVKILILNTIFHTTGKNWQHIYVSATVRWQLTLMLRFFGWFSTKCSDMWNQPWVSQFICICVFPIICAIMEYPVQTTPSYYKVLWFSCIITNIAYGALSNLNFFLSLLFLDWSMRVILTWWSTCPITTLASWRITLPSAEWQSTTVFPSSPITRSVNVTPMYSVNIYIQPVVWLTPV